MKKLICIAALLISVSANATYVSTTFYKSYSCEELKEDRKGHVKNSMETGRVAIKLAVSNIDDESLRDSFKLAALELDQENSDAHIDAIDRAGAKLSCGDLR